MDRTSGKVEAPIRGTGEARVSVRVWDLPTRLFHWSFAALIVFAYVSAEEDSPLRAWHVAAGETVAVLLVFRILWGFIGGEFARFATFVHPRAIPGHVRALLQGRPDATQGHNPLGGIAVALMLLFALGSVATGMLLEGEGPHEVFGTLLIGLAALHVVAVFVMSALTRENLPRAMVTGRKLVPAARRLADARTASHLALGFALFAAAGATVAIRAWDPLAFAPHAVKVHGERHGTSEAGEIEAD